MSDPIDLAYLYSRAAAYIERNPDGGSGLWLADDVLRLIAEVRRLRALPVIATCGECAKCEWQRPNALLFWECPTPPRPRGARCEVRDDARTPG